MKQIKITHCAECPFSTIKYEDTTVFRCFHPAKTGSSRLDPRGLGEDWEEDIRHPDCPNEAIAIVF